MLEGSIAKAFITLILIVAALGGILFLMKKYTRKLKKITSAVNLEVISRISVTPKNHLFIVKAGDKTLLIGASDQNISTLADLTEESDPMAAIEKNLIANDKSAIPDLKTTMQPQKAHINKASLESDPLSFRSFLRQTFKKQVN